MTVRLGWLSRVWADLPLGRKGLVVVAIPLVVLLASAVVLHRLDAEELAAERAVNLSFDVRAHIDRVLSLVTDAETSMRGYLLSGRRDWLDAYHAARAGLPATLSGLRTLVRDTPEQLRRAERVAVHVEQKLVILDGLTRYARAPGRPPVVPQADFLASKDAVDALRRDLTDMHNAEQALMRARVTAVGHRRAIASAGLLLAVVAALGTGIAATLLFTNGVVRRVATLEGNARLLAQGRRLAPAPPGDDEIGRLGRQMQIASELLSERGRALQQMMEGARLALMDVDLVKRETRFEGDAAVLRSMGFDPERMPRTVEDRLAIVHPEDRAAVAAGLAESLTSGRSYAVDYRVVRPDGEVRWLSGRGQPYAVGDDPPRRLLGVLFDVTDVKRAEREAEEANRAKSEFLSRMSHELRTPLNAILGFAQLVDIETTDPGVRESSRHILRAGRQLLQLINEVLDISSIEAGRLRVSLEPVEVGAVVRETLELLTPIAAERRVTLAEPPAASSSYVRADRQRLQQVMLNLVSNAIKYNHEGGTVRVTVTAAGEARTAIAVCDSGRGMTAEQQQRLFVPFERLGAEQSGIEGTGLGLALSRRLIHAMGGTIAVESTVGVGTTVVVDLERVQAPVDGLEGTAEELSGVALAHERGLVLYIEDNPSNVLLVDRVLRYRPAVRLLSATHGRLGITMAREQRPALILLDLNLPDIPGAEVLNELRAMPETARTPVLVISADATPGQTERLVMAGARAYLTKPLNVKELLAHVDAVLGEAREG